MRRLFDILSALVAFVFVVSVSVVAVLMFRPLYYFDVDLLNLAEKTGYSKELIIENYNRLIDYNTIGSCPNLEFDSFKMSEFGKIHFEEVRDIFLGIQYVAIISLVAFMGIMIYKIMKKDLRFLRIASIITITIPAVLGTLVALNWEWVFVKFHELAFDNDYWIFNPLEDEVINILPSEFFMHCAISIVALIFILSAIMFVLGKKPKLTYQPRHMRQI